MNKQPGLVDLSFSKSLELAINTAIHLDEEHGRVFESLDGKVIELMITPFTQPLFCLINQKQIAMQRELNGEADATLKSDISEWIALPFSHNLKAEVTAGDKTIGNEFIEALSHLEIDWEEHLSHYTGDLVAFKVGHGIRSFLERKQTAKAYAGDTIREYLQFEINTLPTRNQVEHFVKDVEQISRDIEKMAERIQALVNHTKQSQ
ncbi:SCP2 domain-containing protein [Thiomicrorhabdus sp. Kp2]|uniref:ubiquinone biosynthesis accessory factor UbiJ n=1 Tax=Thiomicrorhabdus sp. Kp2 TaxID=1123518 RepID=UPI00040936D7|nr:hypothetical protein [Thiomicrorhabdus sp. Kp2]